LTGICARTRRRPAKSFWDTDTAHEFETVNGKAARKGSLDAAGPAVVKGVVFVNSGYGQWGGMPGNVLLAFSVGGR
jgi:polyvinyl alcohol dehydrogenase (cytochrome)